ncbi:hypothetical protein IFM47457_05697 [Aspergillus lentulus]|nr:hypothetical protein IFM47457_05697 [Aspergillus lentulus]
MDHPLYPVSDSLVDDWNRRSVEGTAQAEDRENSVKMLIRSQDATMGQGHKKLPLDITIQQSGN